MENNKTAIAAIANGLIDRSKELQKEILMERLRSKSSQNKNLSETSKAVRMAMLDKRWAIDSQDKMILQKCLDNLQHCIKVSSLQSLIERLECLSRQLGLKFVVGNSGVNIFISSDMFYLEILVESSGAVKDVKIHHEGKMEQQSCEELVSCISRGDFADFTAQLEGLTAVYQLNAEKKIKCKAFSALQSFEEDLCTLKQLQGYIKDPWSQVHKSPIGFLQKRRGGHAMRLTYFVSPYELLDKEKGLLPLTTELLTTGKPTASTGLKSLVAPTHTPIGLSALVLLEGSTANKLQLAPLISNGQRSGKGSNGPVYAQLVPQNSAMLPACFTLKLSEPMPLCAGLAKVIQATTEMEVAGDWANAKPMLGLIAQDAYNKIAPGKNIELNLSKGMYVSLPDSAQCYLMLEGGEAGGAGALSACRVRWLGVSRAAHVPAVLQALRRQAVLNTLLASVLRAQGHARMETENVTMFEVSALSWQHITISLEHPLEESMASVELDLAEPAAPRAALCTLPHLPRENVDDYLTKVLQKTLSIPITMRALLKIWEREAASKVWNGSHSAELSGGNFRSGRGGGEGGGGEPRAPHMLPHSHTHPQPHQGNYHSDNQRHMSMLAQDTEMKSQASDDRKSKKRKCESDPWSCRKKGKEGISEVMDTDSESESGSGNDDNTADSSSSDAEPDRAEPNRAEPDRSEPSRRAPDPPDTDNSCDGDDIDMIRNSFHKPDYKRQKLKSRESELKSVKSTSSLLLDLTDGKPYVASSVSITPITAPSASPNLSSVLCLDRRPGIEIIPIATNPPTTLPSSITITPITSSQAKSYNDRIRSEKKSKSGEDRSKEKKKKKRREDAMGPPNKVPAKQDPLTKPVSVSIKPTEGSPLRSTSPNSMMRKFSPSPTHGRSMSITKSPTHSVKNMGKLTPNHQSSPRHSPVQNSPKHLAGYSSPKHHTLSSPKHSSSGSGKPSMSTLKSAASSSPSGKSGTTGYDLTKKMSKDSYSSSSSSSREKEKKHPSLSFSSSSDRSSPKLKNPIKMKQLEITPIPSDAAILEPLISPPSVEMNKSSVPSQNRNRKGSLSAVIDKLKSAQHVVPDVDLGVVKSTTSTSVTKFSDSKNLASLKINDTKNQEYMVKPSSDGMKITINKTRTKDSSSSGNGSKSNYSGTSSKQSSPQLTPPSQGSPKTHTGLKPGVISGPASKKTQVMQSTSKSTSPAGTPPKSNLSPSDSSSSISSNSPKVPYTKSSSSTTGMNLTKSATKPSSGSPKSGSSDLSKIARDREREKNRTKLLGGNCDKALFSSKSERHSSPSSTRDEVDAPSKNFLVEGLIKPLDTSKFQIPKLKNQNAGDKGSPSAQYDNRSLVNDLSRSTDPSKFPFAHFQNPNTREEPLQKSAYPLNVPKPLINMGSISPKTVPVKDADRPVDGLSKGESPHRGKDESKECFSGNFPLMPLDFKTDKSKSSEGIMRPPSTGPPRSSSGTTTPQEAAEMLLDFSSSTGNKVSGMVAVRPVFPTSPALALQLAKSPAPSPLVAPSPHSNSPCITDDELMDEALVGPGK